MNIGPPVTQSTEPALDKETSEIKAVEKEKPPKAEVTVIISLFRHGLQSFYGSVLIETILICVNRA